MFMCFESGNWLCSFHIFTLLCLGKNSSSILYYLHIPENSQILPTPVSPWGEPVSLSQLSKKDAHMLRSCIHFFLLQEQTNCHLSYIFLQAIPCKGPRPRDHVRSHLVYQLPSLSVLVSVPSQCGDFPANSVVHHYI